MTVVCIAGMHRSGTSMVASLLNYCGVHLGYEDEISAKGFDNPEGFWENKNFKQINDQILDRLQSGWDLPPQTQPDWDTSKFNDLREEAQALINSFEGHAVWGWKDPRNSILFTFWKRLIPEMKIVLCLRNPLEVALSLQKRNQFSIQAGLNLWYAYNSQLLSTAPANQLIVTHYSSYFTDPQKELDRLGSFANLQLTQEKRSSAIRRVIPTLRHQQYTLDDTLSKNPSQNVVDLYIRLCLQSGDVYWLGFDEELSVLRRINNQESEGSSHLLVRLKDQKQQVKALQEKNNEQEKQNRFLREQLQTTQIQLNEKERLLADKDKQIASARLFSTDTRSGRLLNNISAKLMLLMAQKKLRLIRKSNLFDQTFYLANNPDVAAFKLDPVKHYFLYGAFEGRDPGPQFSTYWYRNTYLNINNSGINPFIHYLQYGQKAGYLPMDPNQHEDLNDLSGDKPSPNRSSLKRIYKRIYKNMGLWLRSHFSMEQVEFIKRFLPGPDGIPQHLVYLPEQTNPRNILLEEFDKPDVHTKPDIFILSIIDWNFRHQRPQHIAEGLTKNGRRVFYIEQMPSKNGLEVEKVASDLFKTRLSAKYTGHIQPYSGQPNNKIIQRWINALYELCDAVNATSFKQIIIQHPFWWQMARHLPPEFHITYDCMDDISEFSNTERFILDLEHDLLKNCDKLIVSSQHLFEKYKSVKIPTLIRNAADVEHFAELQTPEAINNFSIKPIAHTDNGRQTIRVGYVGAISDWFDTTLIQAASQLDLNIEYHLCGSVTNPEAAKLEKLSNVRMYGEIKYADAPKFLSQMDVAIIPFQILPIIQACDPVKFYEYSALGIPTVTTPLPELTRASEITLVASTPDDFVHQIHKGYELSKNASFRANLKQYAIENTWEHRNLQFTEVLETFPIVSVIILSYGDPSLTLDAVTSLYYHGKTYPNLEVLIVDNGSPEEQIAMIKDFTKDLSGVRIIENMENLGFAKGNNIGMKQAVGDYIMLLNNDTLVPPGAIYSMVRQLEKNPQAGVVGPLSNNIGNEAKVFVEYEGTEQMIHIVRKLTTGYRGQSTELNVVAYFAAMFRHKDLDLFGYLSEDYGLGMFEDDDHCAIIKSKGYTCLLAEDAFVHHELSASFSERDDKMKLFEKNKAIFETKWGNWTPHQYRKQRPGASFDR